MFIPPGVEQREAGPQELRVEQQAAGAEALHLALQWKCGGKGKKVWGQGRGSMRGGEGAGAAVTMAGGRWQEDGQALPGWASV